MLQTRNASLGRGGRLLLQDITASFAPGTLNVILGPNGAGKSTLLTLLSGEVQPTSGSVLLDGSSLSGIGPRALASRRAVLSQSNHVGFSYTAYEIVRLGLDARGGPADPPWHSVEAALAAVDLAGFGDRYLTDLSGGEQQRVHLARVLCQLGVATDREGARYLLLDEPVASLDIRHQVLTMEIARAFVRAGGCVVVILHDLNLAVRHADRLLVLKSGHVVADGSPGEILTAQRLTEVFDLAMAVHSTKDWCAILPAS